MPITRDPDFPHEVSDLVAAFNRCADKSNAMHVGEAAVHFLACSLAYIAREKGMSRAELDAFVDDACKGLRKIVDLNWERQPQPSDVAVRIG